VVAGQEFCSAYQKPQDSAKDPAYPVRLNSEAQRAVWKSALGRRARQSSDSGSQKNPHRTAIVVAQWQQGPGTRKFSLPDKTAISKNERVHELRCRPSC
jgi:hypothetical protein